MSSKPSLVARLFYFVEGGIEEIDDPPLCKVVDAVKKLDGVDIDTVSVTLRNGDSMSIGGGKDNQYKCHARTKNDLYDMVNPSCQCDANDIVWIMMNNEANKFPRCCVVPLDSVIDAVECFCATGELSQSVSWDNTLEYEPL